MSKHLNLQTLRDKFIVGYQTIVNVLSAYCVNYKIFNNVLGIDWLYYNEQINLRMLIVHINNHLVFVVYIPYHVLLSFYIPYHISLTVNNFG